MAAKTALDRMQERAARIAEGQALRFAHVYSAETLAAWLRDAETSRDAHAPETRQHRTAARAAALYVRAQEIQATGERAACWEDVADAAGIKRSR